MYGFFSVLSIILRFQLIGEKRVSGIGLILNEYLRIRTMIYQIESMYKSKIFYISQVRTRSKYVQ